MSLMQEERDLEIKVWKGKQVELEATIKKLKKLMN